MKKIILLICGVLLYFISSTAQVLPTTSTPGNDVWYYIQCSPRSTDLNAKWLTGGVQGTVLTLAVLSTTDDAQLWKIVNNASGIAIVNKRFGTYIDSDRLYDAVPTSIISSVSVAPVKALKLVAYVDQILKPGGFYLVNVDATTVTNAANASLTFHFYSAGTTANFRPINYGANAPNINSAIQFSQPKEILLASINATTISLNNCSEGVNPGQYGYTTINTLRLALQTAQTVYDNSLSTSSNYMTAVTNLESSLVLFKQNVNLPKVSTGSIEYWYNIQATRPTNTYVTAGVAGSGAQVKELSLIPDDTQLWKLVTNGSGFAIKNKASGEYIQTDLPSASNLATQTTLPTNTLRALVSTEVSNNTNRFWVENTVGSTPAFRLHAGGTGNNNGLMNWTGSAYDNCSWLFLPVGPAINASTVVITNLDYDKGSGPSAEQSFTVSGTSLVSNITLTPSVNIQLSKTSGAGFTNTPITLTQSGGSVNTTTIYVRLKAGLNFATYSDSIVLSSTNATSKNVYCSGTVTRPTIITSTSSVTGLDYDKGSGPSAEQTFTFHGIVLSGNVIVTPSSNLQISKTSGTGFSNTPITLTQTSGILAETTIYVRLKAGLNNANYADSITISSTDAISKKVYCSGTVAGSSINISTVKITGFSYAVGFGPSASKTFSLSANLLTANLIISAGADYELSINNTAFSPGPLTIVPVSGSVNLTTLYVRIKAGLAIGLYDENIIVQSTGVISKTIVCNGTVLGSAIVVSTNQLTDLSYDFTNGPSDQQSFTVGGTDLTANLSVTPTTYFQVSKVSGGVFTSSMLTLSQTGGVVPTTILYVRLKAGLAVASYTGNIAINSTGVSTSTVACSGSVIDLSTGTTAVNDGQLRVFSTPSGIVIEGVESGQLVSVYTVYGSQVCVVKSDGKRTVVPVSPNAVYLLKVTDKTFKVVM